jgi:SAM-dependent methyltransferase
MYNALKSTYHALFPARLRTFLFQNRLARVPRGWVLRMVEGWAGDEEMYTDEYFRTVVDPTGAISAPTMAKSLAEFVRPATAIDVGCGTGQLMMALARHGVSVRGLEFAKPALAICRERGLDVQPFDIEQNQNIDWKADLVVSTEVAEHLPARCADRYVDLLCAMGNTVFMTAAVPGTGGTDHANEQPNSYWIEKMSQRKYCFLETPSYHWRQDWQASGVQSWYCQSAMLFRREIEK